MIGNQYRTRKITKSLADSSSLLIKAFVYLTLGYLKIHKSAMQAMSGEPDSYVLR